MQFSSNPTVRAREVSAIVRQWYEGHRESMSERWFRDTNATDQFIHDLVSEVLRVNAEANPPLPPLPAPPPASVARPKASAPKPKKAPRKGR